MTNPPDFLAVADPSWFPRVLRVLARDYPGISTEAWATAIEENAVEQVQRIEGTDSGISG